VPYSTWSGTLLLSYHTISAASHRNKHHTDIYHIPNITLLGLAQFTKPTVGGDATGLSYGQMLEEPDDGGFDFESMLQESTSVLGGLGLLDAPLSDLQDLQVSNF